MVIRSHVSAPENSLEISQFQIQLLRKLEFISHSDKPTTSRVNIGEHYAAWEADCYHLLEAVKKENLMWKSAAGISK